MRLIWNSARKDLLRLAREPAGVVTWLGIPLLAAFLLNVLFGGGQASPHGLLLIDDQDSSLASRAVAAGFSQGPLGRMLTVERVEEAAGRARLADGEGAALLLVPKGFGAKFLAAEPVTLTLITNPAQRILPDLIREALNVMLDGGFYIQSLLGADLAQFTGPPPRGAATFPDAAIAQFSTRINQMVAKARRYLAPPAIQAETVAHKRPGETPESFAALFFPGMLFMAVLFIAHGLAADVWKERAQGTLRRQITTPAGLWQFAAGKAAAAGLVMLVVAGAAALAVRFLMKLNLQSLPLAAGWVAITGIAMYILLTTVQLSAATERGGNTLANFIVMPLTMLGGSFFPFEAMPAGLRAIGQWTPNGWAVMQLAAILRGAADPRQLAAAFLGIAAVAAAAFLLNLRRLRENF